MDHPEGAGSRRGSRVDFDPRVRLEFRGTQLSLDGGRPVKHELNDALGLSDLASTALSGTRRGKNIVHRLDGLFRHSVFGWRATRMSTMLTVSPSTRSCARS